jgi:hypothetical protein
MRPIVLLVPIAIAACGSPASRTGQQTQGQEAANNHPAGVYCSRSQGPLSTAGDGGDAVWCASDKQCATGVSPGSTECFPEDGSVVCQHFSNPWQCVDQSD